MVICLCWVCEAVGGEITEDVNSNKSFSDPEKEGVQANWPELDMDLVEHRRTQ